MNDVTQLEVKKYWRLIVSRRYIFIAASLVVLSAIIWGSYFMPKMYEAKSTVFIERSMIKNLVQGIAVTPPMEDRLRIITYEMLSRSMLLKVITTMDLDATAKNQSQIEATVRDFQKNTKISVKGNDLFMVSYRGNEPKKVRDYVNTLISKYIEESTSSKREGASGANQFLVEQVNYYKKKIEEAEDALIKFRREKGIYFSVDERSVAATIQNYRSTADEVNMKIKELGAKGQKIKEQLAGEKPLTLALVSSSGEGTGGPLAGRLAQLEQKIPMLLTRYTENHPEVIKTKAEIEAIQKQIDEAKASGLSKSNINSADNIEGTRAANPVYQQLKEDLFRTESDVNSLRAKMASLAGQAAKLEGDLRNVPEEKKALAALERNRDTYKGIYEQLLGRLGRAEVSKQMEVEDKGSSFRIVDPALLPIVPVSPDRLLFILFGIGGGIIAGIGIVLAMEYIDDSIKDMDTLKLHVGLPVLAVIPQIITDNDIEKKNRLDKKVYIASIAYISVICVIFVKELVDRFFLVH